MEPSQSGTPAPYGRACINCSRAKSKCILLATGVGCERCQRLKKDCRPSPTVRKRNGRSAASKTAQLEAKLDSIVSLLQTNGSQSTIPTDWDSSVSASATGSASGSVSKNTSPESHPGKGHGPPFHYTEIPSPAATQSAPSPSTNRIYDIACSLPISPETAEKTLTQFRTENIKFLPFLHIPAHYTSSQFRQEKPFTWLCIMAVSYPGYHTKRDGLVDKITELIHTELLVDVSPDMDMLLGIITFICWVTYSKRPFLNFYSHLVMGLVCDLGINKAIPTDQSIMQQFKCAVGFRYPSRSVRTLEERRAALGVFLITSSTALCMGRIDALRWNPHMEESLTVLLEAKECPEDELLVHLVKIQLVMDKVYHSRRDGEDQSLARFYLESCQTQLISVRNQIPQHLKTSTPVLLYLNAAELLIHEVSMQAPSTLHSPQLHRLESLYTCLQASKAWMDCWLSIAPESYQGIPFTIFFQFSRAIVSLYKLSTLDDPAWDKQMVRNTANILDILDRNAYNMRRCADMIEFDLDPEWSVFEKGCRMIASIKQSWEPKLMEVWYPSLPADGLDNNQFVTPTPDLSSVIPMSGLDDAWMMEVFGSY